MPYRLAPFYRAQPFNTSARFAARPVFLHCGSPTQFFKHGNSPSHQ
jgi:hypothetical protein